MTIALPTPMPALRVISLADWTWRCVHVAAVVAVLTSAAWFDALRSERARSAVLVQRCAIPSQQDQIVISHPGGQCELVTITGPSGVEVPRAK